LLGVFGGWIEFFLGGGEHPHALIPTLLRRATLSQDLREGGENLAVLGGAEGFAHVDDVGDFFAGVLAFAVDAGDGEDGESAFEAEFGFVAGDELAEFVGGVGAVAGGEEFGVDFGEFAAGFELLFAAAGVEVVEDLGGGEVMLVEDAVEVGDLGEGLDDGVGGERWHEILLEKG
jgi:hypothetical protein